MENRGIEMAITAGPLVCKGGTRPKAEQNPVENKNNTNE
jgi:hypothetical protein